MKRYVLVFALIIFSCSALLYAEGVEAGEIVFAEGDGFTVIRADEELYYEPAIDDILGLMLYSGDMILTENDTFIEMELYNSGSRITIAENTTFTLEEIGNTGGGIFNVAYGRIKAKVNKLTEEDGFFVTGFDTVAGVRGTEFGYDLFFDPLNMENGKQTSIYCFEGKVAVAKEEIDLVVDKPVDLVNEDINKNTIIISADQMVVVDSEVRNKPLKKERLNDDIEQYWEDVNQVVLTGPIYIIKRNAENPELSEELEKAATSMKQRYEAAGSFFFSSGTMFTAAGLLMSGLVDGEETLASGLKWGGAAAMALGTGILLYSLTLEEETPPEESAEIESETGDEILLPEDIPKDAIIIIEE